MASDSGEERALRAGRLMVASIRGWLALNRDVTLTRRDVAWVFAYTDRVALPDWTILDTLHACAHDADRNPAELATLLAKRDAGGDVPDLNGGEAAHDEDTVAAGIFIRLNAAAHDHDVNVERRALRMRLGDPDGLGYGRDMLLRILADLHELM